MSPNDDYARPTAVALISLFENRDPNTFHQFTIMIPSDFKLENKIKISYLGKIYGNNEIRFIDMGDMFINASKRWPPSTYYRLNIVNVLPGQKKCIYIDGDVIVRRDLFEMYNINVTNYYVAAVCHYFMFNGGKYKLLGLRDEKNYFCSGVMIMNLENIRRNNLDFVKIQEENRELVGKLQADQEVLNMGCNGKALCLKFEYGLLINKVNDMGWVEKNPTIVHFAAIPKPWKNARKTFFHKEWWKYAEKTKLYDKEIDDLKQRTKREGLQKKQDGIQAKKKEKEKKGWKGKEAKQKEKLRTQNGGEKILIITKKPPKYV